MSQSSSAGQSAIKWDIVGGLVIVLIGAGFLYFGSNLRPGTLARMGPGYVPVAVSIIMMILGAAIVLQGWWGSSEEVHWPSFRALGVVVMCPILFALLIGPLGLVLTILIVASVARLAEGGQSFALEAILVPTILALFCVVLFTYLLSLPIPLWP